MREPRLCLLHNPSVRTENQTKAIRYLHNPCRDKISGIREI
ncbi:Uncharacterized protein dnm_007220 [Desulfonema magnum]|uniref:Uncharacterized protein n=1 Tax=Desulfonema magnum TaxID=45655 RepID=A0A975BG02_9BACT|nr:Uncharacterized protein dnm_007220 [Desulfonema magnum]